MSQDAQDATPLVVADPTGSQPRDHPTTLNKRQRRKVKTFRDDQPEQIHTSEFQPGASEDLRLAGLWCVRIQELTEKMPGVEAQLVDLRKKVDKLVAGEIKQESTNNVVSSNFVTLTSHLATTMKDRKADKAALQQRSEVFDKSMTDLRLAFVRSSLRSDDYDLSLQQFEVRFDGIEDSIKKAISDLNAQYSTMRTQLAEVENASKKTCEAHASCIDELREGDEQVKHRIGLAQKFAERSRSPNGRVWTPPATGLPPPSQGLLLPSPGLLPPYVPSIGAAPGLDAPPRAMSRSQSVDSGSYYDPDFRRAG